MPFIPDSFDPPRHHETPHLLLQVLSPDYATEDYACVMACADQIRGVFGPDNGWPDSAMTLAQNYADLVRHEREFVTRVAFAYAIFEKTAARRYVGCLYIKPIKSRIEHDRRKALFDAQAFCWFSPQETDAAFAALAVDELMLWIKSAWPCRAVAFPGRTLGWDEWNTLAVERVA